MAISRAQLAKELEPGLNALFGLNTTATKTSMRKSSMKSLRTVHLKKK